MRVSSVTVPSASGTLRSTRTSARLPSSAAGGRSRRRRFFNPASPLEASDVRQQVHAAGRVADLVVVPGRDVHERAVDDVRGHGVYDAGVQTPDVIGRHERLVAHVEDALEETLRGLAEGGVDLFD